MGFFTISCFKSYFYLLIYWLLDLSITIVRDLYLDEEISDIEYVKGTEFIYISCLTLADLFAGFLVCYTIGKIKKMKKESEKKESNEKNKKKNLINDRKKSENKKTLSLELIYNDQSIRKYKFNYLILISILEFIARSTDLLYLLIIKKMTIRPGEINWLISVDTFARILFSRLMLSEKIYKHHKFSLVLILIGLCSMSICAFQAIVENELNSWPYFLFIVGKYLILPLEDVINKILLTVEFLLPHYLMLWRGIFNFFMLGILALSVVLPGIVKFGYFSQFKTKTEIFIQVLMKVLFTIFSFCKAFCLLKVIDIFSPKHVAFLNTAFSLYQLIKCRTKSKDNIVLTVIDAIFLVVIIFGTMIFTEMIIINAFGLNKDTKIGFILKERKEIEDIKASTINETEPDEGNDEKYQETETDYNENNEEDNDENKN